MATAESVKAQLQSLIDSANAATGNEDTDLTTAMAALIAGFGRGDSVDGTRGIYMAQITPAEDVDSLEIIHNLGTADVMLAAVWAKTLGGIVPVNNNTLAKFWAKTDVTTQRGGNGFSPGYGWNTTNSYATSQAPNTAAYETLAITENSVIFPRTGSGSGTVYLTGVTYTVIIIAASAFSAS